MHVDQIQKTVVRCFVFRQFPRIGTAHGLSPTRGYAARPVGHVRVAVVEVEQARCQAHGQVRGCHLVVERVVGDMVQEVEQGFQRFSMFVRQKEEDTLNGVRSKFQRYICAIKIEGLFFQRNDRFNAIKQEMKKDKDLTLKYSDESFGEFVRQQGLG